MKIILLIAIILGSVLLFGSLGYILIYRPGRLQNLPSYFTLITTHAGTIGGIFTTFFTLLSIYLAYKSLVISETTYKDAQVSGPKQQAALDNSVNALREVVNLMHDQRIALDSSREALEKVNETTTKQQQTIAEGLAVAQDQYALIRKQEEDRQKVLAMRPEFEISGQIVVSHNRTRQVGPGQFEGYEDIKRYGKYTWDQIKNGAVINLDPEEITEFDTNYVYMDESGRLPDGAKKDAQGRYYIEHKRHYVTFDFTLINVGTAPAIGLRYDITSSDNDVRFSLTGNRGDLQVMDARKDKLTGRINVDFDKGTKRVPVELIISCNGYPPSPPISMEFVVR